MVRSKEWGKRLAFDHGGWYLAGMSGISFVIDERGKKTAAVIDLRQHGKLWEDFYDSLLVAARAEEPRESLEEVKRRLRLRPKVNG